jgi:SAM-dependent methyltransferase
MNNIFGFLEMDMNLTDIVNRKPRPAPWEEGEKLPWNDPEFGQRMLKEHLSQQHDAASRRTPRIKKHVDWIHNHVLSGQPARLLDLGCGPGLYAARLTKLGHTVTGIDFSPASIEYAVKTAEKEHLAIQYQLGDLRTADFGSGYDLVMFIYSEFNVFRPAEASALLKKAWAALKPGGQILLEVNTVDCVDQRGNQPAMWYSSQSGLFSDQPHLCLMDNFWDEEQAVATERFLIIDAKTGAVTRYAFSTQAYTEEQYSDMLTRAGFRDIDFYPSLSGVEDAQTDEMYVVVARK